MDANELVRIKSSIAQAYWCDTSKQIAKFELAEIDFDTTERQTLSWFDTLFEGGIMLPKCDSEILHPLTMLVSGPPGCGKTTLISELCYHLAINDQKNPKPLSTLYISTDAETGPMIHNAIDFGWDKAEDYFIPFDPNNGKPQLKQGLNSMVGVWGREKFLNTIDKQDVLSAIIEGALNSLDQWIIKANAKGLMDMLACKVQVLPIEKAVKGSDKKCIPDILVIDSLNILNPEGQTKFFQAFVKACKATKLVIFILNTGAGNQDHKPWEYFSDIVLHLDYEYIHDYYVRTIEVVKARFQVHRWGKHQLKIYAKPKNINKPLPTNNVGVPEYNIKMKRSHPYQPIGGVFIFPSIHSYLSVYKRKTASEKPDQDETYPEKLNQIFKIPKGKCTAFIGQRGGHKSHLGYLHLLNRVLNFGGAGLIVSLREDEGTTKETLADIAKIEFKCKRNNFNKLEPANQLEILYFPPGFITPEEFFHRIFISIHRLKMQGSPITVLFNSLDQISARFPLCAKQEIFIPGIIQTLSGEGVTSIFIAVDEPSQPVQQYGLLPMADLIVSFSLRRFLAQNYYNHLSKSWQIELADKELSHEKFNELQKYANTNPSLTHEAIVLQVIRFSGGERAGKRGILELVKGDELKKFPYSKAGLHFTPLSEELTKDDLSPD